MNGLPLGWAGSTVGEVGHVMLGRQRSPKYHLGAHMRPYLRVKNVFEDRIELSDVMEMDFPPAHYETYRLEPGDILLNEGQSPELVGRPAMYRGELPGSCFTNSLIRFQPRDGVDGRYALYIFRHYLRSGRFQREARITTNIAHLSAQRFSSVEFPVAPLAEQRRIVAAIEEQFSRLDAAEASLRSARVKLAAMRRRVLDSLLAGDWPRTTLGEIAEVVGGVTKDGKRQSDPSFVEVPYLRVANVQRGYLDLSEVTTIRVPGGKAAALALRPGDVLFNEGGDRDKLGRGWVWSGEIPSCIHQNHVFRARLIEGFEPKFVSLHGNTFGRTWFEAHGKQTTNLASISLRTLKTFPVPAPPLDEQRRIVAEVERQLSILDATKAAIDRALERSKALRRAILERAFTGRLVPQDPSDEPASVLLERIRAERAAAAPRAGRR